jgi:hypothetical protein
LRNISTTVECIVQFSTFIITFYVNKSELWEKSKNIRGIITAKDNIVITWLSLV